ncbi:MAG: DNA polymerase III subunit chi [Pseudomonadota bacterium]|nr:DNA polymerase III subunit chi [Pseudomonadota bacterium]
MKNEAFFYIIKEPEKLNQIICQVIKHFYKNKYKILVNTQDDQQIKDLDSLLWTFEQISFIPHSTDENIDMPAPVVICNKNSLSETFDSSSFKVLFNLSHKIQKDWEDFEKIVEFVLPKENQKTISREHYLFYKNNNFIVKHETI